MVMSSIRPRPLSRRSLIAALGGLTAGALLAACGGASASPTVAPAKPTEAPRPAAEPTKPAAAATTAPAPAPTTAPAAAATTTPAPAPATKGQAVAFLDVIINDDLSKRADDILKKFSQDTGMEVKLDRTPYPAFADKVPTLLSSGAPPDLYWADTSKYPEYVQKGWLTAFDELLAGSKALKKADFVDSAWQKVSYQGKIYGMPKDWSVRGGYYNQALFEQLKVAKAPETTAELKQVALEIKQKDASLFGYMWPMKTPDTWMFEGLAYIMLANGGSVLSDDGTKVTFNSPQVEETMAFFVDIWKAKAAPEQGVSSTNQDLYPLFGSGKVAMMHTGFFVIAGLLPKIGPEKYNTFVVKGSGGGYGTPMSVSAFSLPTQAKNKEGAWRLVETILQPDNVTAFTTNPSARPADAPENKSRFSDPRYLPFFQVADKGGKWWITPNPGISDQMRIVHEASQAIILGQKSITQGLTDAAADLEKTLKK